MMMRPALGAAAVGMVLLVGQLLVASVRLSPDGAMDRAYWDSDVTAGMLRR